VCGSRSQSWKYAHCTWLREGGRKPSWRISGQGVGEGFVLPEGSYAPPVIVREVRSGSGCCNHNIDLWVEARAILGDPDESIRVTSCYGQFLDVVRVPVDVSGALEVGAGFEIVEGLILLVLLYEPEAEVYLELGPAGEQNGSADVCRSAH
jgi:hypothetical protein